MTTIKPISTISYNTKDFLIYKLNDLIDRKYLSFYAFIEHLAEEDEKKNHFHLYILPNMRIDTDLIKKELEEMDIENDIPLGCMPFQSSKFSDWYYYVLHDFNYLISKGLERKYHYTINDIISSSADYLVELVHTLPITNDEKCRRYVDKVIRGEKLSSMLKQGIIPIGQYVQYKGIYDYLVSLKNSAIHE